MRCPALFLGVALLLTDSASAGPAWRDRSRPRILNSARDVAQAYDYIIVGGGTSGLTVADRLTEDGHTSVLVIEYGQLSTSVSEPTRAIC